MRVLHVLHHSAPYLDGYGVRSKYIVDFQRRLGLKPAVITSAHHEIEIKRVGSDFQATETIDGLSYHRTRIPEGPTAALQLRTPWFRERALMSALGRSLERAVREQPVDVIHSHSPVLCGRPALELARRLGVPMVYEVRAFWEDAFQLGAKRLSVATAKYHYSKSIETALLKEADAVIAIFHLMVDDIASRGIPRSKLHRMPNGVDTQVFAPVARDQNLANRLGIRPGSAIGFIGTFHSIEGIDCLVSAMPAIIAAVPDARLILVGTGPEHENVRQQIQRLGLGDRVVLTGLVKHHEVQRYYSVIDLLVYPRHSFRVTELVTPLKPLEAMAMGKAVIGSDVGGIRELLDDGRAGTLFRAGDSADLARHAIRLLTNLEVREEQAEAGRRYALRERDWAALIPGYLPIYEGLVAHRVKRSA